MELQPLSRKLILDAMKPSVAALLGLMACSGLAVPELEEYDGYYAFGWESWTFQPCGSSELWWVDHATPQIANFIEANRSVFESTDPLEPGLSGKVYVQVQGQRSRPGVYGHLGLNRYELRMERSPVVRIPSEADCAT